MRRKLASALAYAVLAAAISATSLSPPQPLHSTVGVSVNARLLVIVLTAVVAALTPFLQTGLKELFRQALTHGKKKLWRQALLAALFQVAIIGLPLLLIIALGSRVEPVTNHGNATSVSGPYSSGEPLQQGSSSDGGEPSSSRSDSQLPSEASQPEQWVVGEGLVLAAAGVLIAVTAVTAAYSVYDAWREVRANRSREQVVSPEEEELLKATSEAIREVEEGADPRGAIVNYFLKLCKLLEEQGVSVSEELTAREVAQVALQKFKRLEPEPLLTLVHLFEEARYSSHIVSEVMRDKALESFKSIQDQLKGVSFGS
ncbi:MAG: DUF4129 domain-containing protein [Thermofilaceae archaeon]|nr:DUF4129 domain-containing protein [Thermofilaceae archaeon]